MKTETRSGRYEDPEAEFDDGFASRFSNLSMKDANPSMNDFRPNRMGRNPRDSDFSMADLKERRSGLIAGSFFSRFSDLSMDSVSYSTANPTSATIASHSTGFSSNTGFSSGFSSQFTGSTFSDGFPTESQKEIGKPFDLGSGTTFSTGASASAGESGNPFERDLSDIAFSSQNRNRDFSNLHDGRNYSDLSVDSVDHMRCSNLSQTNFFIKPSDILHESPSDVQEPPNNVEEPPTDFKFSAIKPGFASNSFQVPAAPARTQPFFQNSSSVSDRQHAESKSSGMTTALKSETKTKLTLGENETKIKTEVEEEDEEELVVPKFIEEELQKTNGSGEFKIKEMMIMLFYVHYFFDHTDVYSKASEYMQKKRSRASIRHKIIKIVHKNSGHKGSILQNKGMTNNFKTIINKEFWRLIETAEEYGEDQRKDFAKRLRQFAIQKKMRYPK
eukprot:CAMPEP_0184016544 /NCGR_PEP_ID=MMETSP0954-20121128/6988_1 /TAXON_ID=627963 /ORGANISM="Aplanochytrium sp, Strain PBS07" /LENGTH=444 /DNA_ID=CAMNT_0026297577 /DNA_START=340 /DNA_END=1674 /DNA_ORIENTATION=+